MTKLTEEQNYRVLLRKNLTEECRWYTYDSAWNDNHFYLWREGDYSCDCNRHLFFEEACGHDVDFDDHACGEGEYAAIVVELPDGTQYQLDLQEERIKP